MISQSQLQLVDRLQQQHMSGITHLVLNGANVAAGSDKHTSRQRIEIGDFEVDGRSFVSYLVLETAEIEPATPRKPLAFAEPVEEPESVEE